MKIQSVFKKLDPIYGKFLVGDIYKQNLELAIKLTEPYSKVVLDVGFGVGILFPYLVSYTEECYGININRNQSTKAKGALDSLGIKPNLITADIRKAPFGNSSFEVIYALNTLEHIKEIDTTLAEIKRILKSGGYFVVAVPTENLIYRVGRVVIGYGKKPKGHHHTAKEIKARLLRYFDITAEKAINSIVPLFKVYLCRKD